MSDYTATSGFLIEKTFARMCREYLADMERDWPHLLNQGGFSVPRTDVPPEQMPRQYRGLHREPIQGWIEVLRGSGVVEPTDGELEASLFLTELERAGKADDVIFSRDDTKQLMAMIEPPVEREIVWARCMEASDPPLPNTVVLGYEPSSFYPPECNSAVAECMFFAWWLCGNVERPGLTEYHDKLNKWGLFDTPTEAEQYLGAYLNCLEPGADEREYNYHIVEVRILT